MLNSKNTVETAFGETYNNPQQLSTRNITIKKECERIRTLALQHLSSEEIEDIEEAVVNRIQLDHVKKQYPLAYQLFDKGPNLNELVTPQLDILLSMKQDYLNGILYLPFEAVVRFNNMILFLQDEIKSRNTKIHKEE